MSESDKKLKQEIKVKKKISVSTLINIYQLIEKTKKSKENSSKIQMSMIDKFAEDVCKFKFKPITINNNPSYIKEIILQDRIIPINSNYMISSEKDRPKSKYNVDLKYYYNTTEVTYNSNNKFYSLRFIEKNPEKLGSDNYNYLRYAIDYYKSLNDKEGLTISEIFKAKYSSIQNLKFPEYLTREKTWIKNITKNTRKWVTKQIWTSTISILDHARKIEHITKLKLSNEFLNIVDLKDFKDFSDEKKKTTYFKILFFSKIKKHFRRINKSLWKYKKS